MASFVIPGLPHHITQRGNNRQDVFFIDDDRATYLRLLGEESAKHGLAINGYCLMTNHVHLQSTPSTTIGWAARRRIGPLSAQLASVFRGFLGRVVSGRRW